MSLAAAKLSDDALVSSFRWMLTQARAPVMRSMADWVEQEIVLPNGPFAGERYRHHRHPVSRLWFDAVDSGNWTRFAATGPTQNGKTLMCYVAPVLYHLFEIGETVIVGLPSMDMANDKWSQDFKPVIEASRYRSMLPVRGEGSKGGQVKRSITFTNGAVLRFMSGGGGDKKRAGYTARVVAVTETDGMDEPGETSREADKIEQLEGRTRAFGRTGKRIYLECTVSIERGRIWQEVKQGTDSRIVRPCPHCDDWVAPEREHLVGWQSAASEGEAAAAAFWSCPSCGEAWSEDERRDAAAQEKLIHAGQEIVDGEVTGEPPNTQTLGFRWSAVDNPFVSAADLGAEEWRARRSKDRESAEKKMRQFIWTLPYEPPDIDIVPLDPDQVRERTGDGFKHREVPNDCVAIVVTCDTGKRKLHWEAKAIREAGGLVVIDYGGLKVEADSLGVFRGLVEAFGTLHKYIEAGWQSHDGRKWTPAQVWIDSGYHEHTDAVYAFCEAVNQAAGLPRGKERYRPVKGYGEGQKRMTRYLGPTHKDRDVVHVGRGMHVSMVRRNGLLVSGVLLVHLNADYWKSETHQRLAMPAGEPGAITLYDGGDPYAHSEYAAHLTAEKMIEKFSSTRGTIEVWERVHRQNHFFDTAYMSTAAAQFVLDLLAKPAKKARPTLAEMARQK